ncbi:hypothetical protein EOC93_24375, partial [Mesorhizobium sp. M6A.T.Ce.TU.002.03.1.1]
ALGAMTVKTDRNDAQGIAQIVRTGWFKAVHLKSAAGQRLRTLTAAGRGAMLSAGDSSQSPQRRRPQGGRTPAALRSNGRAQHEC